MVKFRRYVPPTEAELQKPFGPIPRNIPITHILVHKGLEEGYQGRMIWAVYLQMSETLSYRLQLLIEEPEERLRPQLRMSTECLVRTPDTDLVFPVQVPAVCTFETVVAAINYRRHAIYQFTARQHADRFWLYTMMTDIEDKGVVAKGSSQVVWDRMENDKPTAESILQTFNWLG